MLLLGRVYLEVSKVGRLLSAELGRVENEARPGIGQALTQSNTFLVADQGKITEDEGREQVMRGRVVRSCDGFVEMRGCD